MPIYTNKDNTRLYYELHGKVGAKNTLVFMNGVMASANSWLPVLPVFEKLDVQILLHDFKGQLRSDKPEGPYTFDEHALECLELFEYLKLDAVHLIGTSYGSEVSMRLAMNHPERASSLTLIDGVSELDEVLKAFIDLWHQLLKLPKDQFFLGMAPTIYGSKFYGENKEFLLKRAKEMRAVPDDYMTGQAILYECFKHDVTMTDRLHEIRIPTLVIVGEDDILKPRKFSDILAKNITNSEYAVLPEVGHVAIFEAVDILQSLIAGFILKHLQ